MVGLMYEDALRLNLHGFGWAMSSKSDLYAEYIDRHKDEYIRRQLRLRGRQNLTLILWRAKTSMKQMLESQKSQI
jgi:hypothetical protein